MASVRGPNHVTLAVADLGLALPSPRWSEGVPLEAGGLWLRLSVSPVTARGDCAHLASDVPAAGFDALAGPVRAAAPVWRENRSEGASLYVLDPDGRRRELHAGSLRPRLAHDRADPDGAVAIFERPGGGA